jgi:putative addiction module component (TIGR02574 family)
MPISINEIEFSSLSLTDRLILAQRLLDSVTSQAVNIGIAVEDLAVLDKRAAGIDAGAVNLVPWETVFPTIK